MNPKPTHAGSADPAPFELVCPVCGEPLVVGEDSFRCERCRRVFPVVAGIPDLRLVPDRYLTLDEDRRKAERLANVDGSALDVVDAYWAMTPEVPRGLARVYRDAAMRSTERGRAILDRANLHGPRLRDMSLLDVGCGVGGLVVAAAQRGMRAVGIDAALRWLVVCARLASDEGVDARFYAADGSMPPFRPDTFDVVTCIETLEHSADPRGTLQRSLALSRRGFLAVTSNRYSVVPDPTLRLWLAGYLPRSLFAGYVRARRSTGAEHYAPPSVAEVHTWFGPAPPGMTPAVTVRASRLPPPSNESPRGRRRAAALHDRLVSGRFEPAVRAVAPMIEIRRGLG